MFVGSFYVASPSSCTQATCASSYFSVCPHSWPAGGTVNATYTGGRSPPGKPGSSPGGIPKPAIVIIIVATLSTCCIVLCILRIHQRSNQRAAREALLYDVDGGGEAYSSLGGGGMPYSYSEPGTFMVTGPPAGDHSYHQPVPPPLLTPPPQPQPPPPQVAPPPPQPAPQQPPPPQDPLEIWTEELALPSHAYLALRRVGVSRIDDLSFLDDAIIDELGLPPVARKKLAAAVAALVKSREGASGGGGDAAAGE